MKKPLPAAKWQEQARAYADWALGLLRQAVAKGYQDAAHMKNEKDLSNGSCPGSAGLVQWGKGDDHEALDAPTAGSCRGA